jgi:hypothetical protein
VIHYSPDRVKQESRHNETPDSIIRAIRGDNLHHIDHRTCTASHSMLRAKPRKLSEQLAASLPNDSTSGRLAFEVHYYEPYSWSLMREDAWWGKMFYFWVRKPMFRKSSRR